MIDDIKLKGDSQGLSSAVAQTKLHLRGQIHAGTALRSPGREHLSHSNLEQDGHTRLGERQ